MLKPCYSCGRELEVRELPLTPNRACPNRKCRAPMDEAAVDATYFEAGCRELLRAQALSDVAGMWAEPAAPAAPETPATPAE